MSFFLLAFGLIGLVCFALLGTEILVFSCFFFFFLGGLGKEQSRKILSYRVFRWLTNVLATSGFGR